MPVNPYIRFLLLLGALLLSTTLQVQGQEHTLLRYARSHPVSEADSARIIGLIKASQAFEYKHLDTAIAMVDKAMRQSRELNFTYGIGNAYIAYSVYATTAGQYRQSDSLLEQAYPYCVETALPGNNNRLLIHWYQIASTQAAYSGAYDKSVNLACTALQLLNQRPDDTTFNDARIKAYNAIGSMMQYMRQPERAFYFLDKGIALATTRNDHFNLAQLYVNYGSACNLLKQWPRAKDYLSKAITLAKADDNTFVLQVAYLTQAGMYIDMGEQDNAINSLKLATGVSDKTNPFMAKATPERLLAQVYFDRKDYHKSISHALTALAIAEKMQSPQNISNAHALLADAYHATGQWEKAYTHQFAYTHMLDSLRNTATLANINQLEIKSRVAEKDIELAKQQLSLNRKESALREKNFWIAGISAGLLLLAALLLSIRRNFRNRQQLQESTREVERLKARMDGAEQERQRIATELHDGVVSQLWGLKLNLSSAIGRQEADSSLQPGELRQSLDDLDDAMQELRATAHNLSPEMALQAGLIDALSGFCSKMNHRGHTDVVFQVYGQLQPTDKHAALSIFRNVQELVLNALKHAQAATILVQLNCEEDILGVTVQDDGNGFDPAAAVKGMGLQNVTERIHAFNASIDLQSGARGTSIYMEFKYIHIAPTGAPVLL